MPFEIVVKGPPVSQQTRNRRLLRRWIERVRLAAQERRRGESPDDGWVSVTIAYYFLQDDLDVDNIPKPILDALNEVAYNDDRQVRELCCSKRDIGQMRLPPRSPTELLANIGTQEPLVFIEVDEAAT